MRAIRNPAQGSAQCGETGSTPALMPPDGANPGSRKRAIVDPGLMVLSVNWFWELLFLPGVNVTTRPLGHPS